MNKTGSVTVDSGIGQTSRFISTDIREHRSRVSVDRSVGGNEEYELKLKVTGKPMSATIYQYGGSYRMTLPKKVTSMLGLELEAEDSSQVVLIPTDYGILITTLNTLLVADHLSNLLRKIK